MNDISQLSRILEGALFAADKPLSLDQMLALFPEEQQPEKKTLRDTLAQLQTDYEKRGIELKELGSGWQFQACPDLAQWVGRLWEERPPRYSRALLETLALVAYRQPITRGEIEEVRGVVVSTNIMRTLLEREWVRVVGHKDVPGHPALYATTKQFLDYFGLSRLEELPSLSEIADIDTLGKNLEEKLQEAGEDTEGEQESSDEESEVVAETTESELMLNDDEAEDLQDEAIEEETEEDEGEIEIIEETVEEVEADEVEVTIEEDDEIVVNERELLAEEADEDELMTVESSSEGDDIEVGEQEPVIEESIESEQTTAEKELEENKVND